jgi:hypothetical protein
MNAGESDSLQSLQREQNRLRIGLAVWLLLTTVLFALAMSWLAQDSALRPLQSVGFSFIALTIAYAVGVAVAAVYSRWIRAYRDAAVKRLGAARE